ncbi:hypothetical protein P4B35_10310 [Pontiellaceae bacterium B12227]|nr:hypothetical protein [Pontiellaceae bacterium B12227]
MKKRTTLLTIGLLISTLIGNMAYSQREKKATPVEGFPEATVTIFPLVQTITGPTPTEKYKRFAKAVKQKYRADAKGEAEFLGLLLEEKGYDQYVITDAEFWFPEEEKARKDRAAIFSKAVAQQELKTDYALCADIIWHIEKSCQEVYAVLVDAQGKVVWEDRQGHGDPEFDSNFPGTPRKCIALLRSRLTPVMGLDALPRKKLAPEKEKILRELRMKEPPKGPEFAAIEKRLNALKKAAAVSRMQIYPSRVDGDYTVPGETQNLVSLINKSKLIKAGKAKDNPKLEGQGWPNEMEVLWLFANTVKEYARQHPIDSDYALFADYWRTPRGQVWAVHFVILDRNGDWVIVDMQNNHKNDFRQINPQNLEGCNALVLKRLEGYLH